MLILSKIRKALDEGGFSLLLLRVNTSFKLFIRPLPKVFPQQLYHRLPKGLPFVRWSIRPILQPTQDDVRLAARILASYNRAISDEYAHQSSHTEDIWDLIKMNRHDDFNKALSSNNPRKVAEYFCNLHIQGIAHAISDFNARDLTSKGSRAGLESMVLTKDHMIALAEAVGTLLYAQDNVYKDAELVVKGIEEKIGIDIMPPDIDGGLLKAQFGDAHFSLRDIWGIYVAWRLDHLVGANASICEIGGGLGKVALYAHRLNFKKYTLFDLPQINAVQAWYLVKAIPDANIELYGENANDTNAIRILPYWIFPSDKYDIVLNVDSFPEIATEIVIDYLNKIKDCAALFLSINHETERSYGYIHGKTTGMHLAVPRIIEDVGGFERQYRFPLPVRKNYVEELYKIG